MVRFSVYAVGSTLLCASVMYYAYHTREQFYPAVIFLVTSKLSVMVMANMALVMTLLAGRVTKCIFLGTLREAEVETLYENSRYAITETCLALTIFREEINVRVVALFTSLLFAKIFLWLCQCRVEHIEQAESVSRLTHLRIVALMATLAATDAAFVAACSYITSQAGPSVLILFGFEFLVLLVSLTSTFLRYVLHLIDLRVEGTWNNKSAYLFYIELATEIVRLFVYLVFFMIIFTYYGMPLHIVRDLWVSIKNLERRLTAYFRYRKLTANMNERFPNATEEELNAGDRVCIICREEMESDGAKKLPCSHIFHFYCLRLWLQRQQTCPTCRAEIPADAPQTRPTPAGPAPPPNGAAADQATGEEQAGGQGQQGVPPEGLGGRPVDADPVANATGVSPSQPAGGEHQQDGGMNLAGSAASTNNRGPGIDSGVQDMHRQPLTGGGAPHYVQSPFNAMHLPHGFGVTGGMSPAPSPTFYPHSPYPYLHTQINALGNYHTSTIAPGGRQWPVYYGYPTGLPPSYQQGPSVAQLETQIKHLEESIAALAQAQTSKDNSDSITTRALSKESASPKVTDDGASLQKTSSQSGCLHGEKLSQSNSNCSTAPSTAVSPDSTATDCVASSALTDVHVQSSAEGHFQSSPQDGEEIKESLIEDGSLSPRSERRSQLRKRYIQLYDSKQE